MKTELAVFIEILRQQCPEFFDVLAPGLEADAFPPSLRLTADLLEFYRWSAGVDMDKVFTTPDKSITADYRLLFLHYFGDFNPLSWESFPTDFNKRRFMDVGWSWARFPDDFEGLRYYYISADDFGNHFLVRADGQSDTIFFLGEGSDTPVPAFANMTAIISTLNTLFQTGNLYYELEDKHPSVGKGQERNLKYTEEAYKIIERLNKTPDTALYWDGD